MSFLDSLWAGICALRANRIRTTLTMFGIVIGVAAVICMLSIGMGAQSDVAERICTLGSSKLNPARRWRKPTSFGRALRNRAAH